MSILRPIGLAASILAVGGGAYNLGRGQKFYPNPDDPMESRCADNTSLIGHAIGNEVRRCLDIQETNATLINQVRHLEF